MARRAPFWALDVLHGAVVPASSRSRIVGGILLEKLALAKQSFGRSCFGKSEADPSLPKKRGVFVSSATSSLAPAVRERPFGFAGLAEPLPRRIGTPCPALRLQKGMCRPTISVQSQSLGPVSQCSPIFRVPQVFLDFPGIECRSLCLIWRLANLGE